MPEVLGLRNTRPGSGAAPRFSVLITSYNYKRYLGEAVDSALKQTHPALEVIVVDDGSTDGSRELLQREYAGRVRVLHKDNGGQLSAFAAGIGECRGEVVCFLDADDVWEPAYLAELAATCRAQPQFANVRFFGGREGYWSGQGEDRDHGLTCLAAVFGR